MILFLQLKLMLVKVSVVDEVAVVAVFQSTIVEVAETYWISSEFILEGYRVETRIYTLIAI